MKYPLKNKKIINLNNNKKNNFFIQLSPKKNYIKKNLGLNLEKDINLTNLFYKKQNIALIFKNEIPVKITKVEYPKRQKAKIVQAYFNSNSLPDYHGLYRGRYLSFDTKETNHKTNFSLNNIPLHQIENLKKINKLNGIAFFIIHFKFYNKYFYMPINFLTDFLKKNKNKSINYKIFEEKMFCIPYNYVPRLDYLKIVDKFIK
jgi:recombination protein U